MATGRSGADRERLFSEGRCMAPRCRQVVKNGDGSQFLEEDASYSRFCTRCASSRMQGAQATESLRSVPAIQSA
jgi:hypothetical protein